jgi:sterol desaturase/sphingolipid hydroxylase (fatty acid hydroxylase superfamily)
MASFGIDLLRLCAWLALLLAVFAPLERKFGGHSQKLFRKSFGADVFYYFLNGIVTKLLMIVPLTVLVAVLHGTVPLAFYKTVGGFPFWLRIAAALVASEVGGYWGHRWTHEIPFLWRFHNIHHSAEELDWLVTAKAHPVDIVFTHFCSLVPMYVLGLAQPLGSRVDLVPMIVTVAGTFWGYFIHANLNWRFGWLEWLISTPAFHHWHHTNDGPEVINKNYSSMLPWVDRCFGTLYLPHSFPEKYGSDTPLAPDLTGQLLLLREPSPQPQALACGETIEL